MIRISDLKVLDEELMHDNEVKILYSIGDDGQ